MIGKPVAFSSDCVGEEAKAKALALGNGDVLLLDGQEVAEILERHGRRLVGPCLVDAPVARGLDHVHGPAEDRAHVGHELMGRALLRRRLEVEMRGVYLGGEMADDAELEIDGIYVLLFGYHADSVAGIDTLVPRA